VGGAAPAPHPDHLVTAATAAVEVADESAPVAAPRGLDEVVVLDFGGQYSQLIARRVRECGVFSELLPHHVGVDEVRRRRPKGLILSGGPASVYAEGAPGLDPELLELGIPVLGICYGMQLIARELGGRVEAADVGEYGRSQLSVRDPGRLLAGLPLEQPCWMSHRDTVFAPPPGFTALASSSASPVAALESVERGIYGIQFHPEVVHTPFGQDVLRTFLSDVCGCDMAWSAASIVEEQLERIREQVGDSKVICGLSGGVDSSVAALLVHRAVGDQLTCVFVDHGMMRKNEGEQVVRTFRDTFQVPLVAVDAEDRFLDKLRGVSEPEAKRKIIGTEFIRVFEEEALQARGEADPPGPAKFLVQGTLYSDVIESGGGTGASTIKSHHNVGGCPTTSTSSSSSRCVRCSRTRCAPSGPSSGCPSASCGASPSPGRAWRSAWSAARRRRSAWTSCATRTRSSRTRSARPACTGAVAVLLRPARRADRRGPGRRAHLRLRRRPARRDLRRRDDRGLGPPALRPARADRRPHDRRAARGQPRGAGHHVKPPGTIEWE
jgi:GMP synthase (glutamine-hydrolysing)